MGKVICTKHLKDALDQILDDWESASVQLAEYKTKCEVCGDNADYNVSASEGWD